MKLGTYGETPTWQPRTPRLGAVSLALSWLVGAVAVAVAAWIVPGVELAGAGAALLVVAVVAAINAVLPPLLAALRLPFEVAIGFFAVLAADAGAQVWYIRSLGKPRSTTDERVVKWAVVDHPTGLILATGPTRD